MDIPLGLVLTVAAVLAGWFREWWNVHRDNAVPSMVFGPAGRMRGTMVTSTKARRTYGRRDDVALDNGCGVGERCVSCPWRVCVAELPRAERPQFVEAWRLVRSHLAAPDGTLE